jgi:hypothetical protein
MEEAESKSMRKMNHNNKKERKKEKIKFPLTTQSSAHSTAQRKNVK